MNLLSSVVLVTGGAGFIGSHLIDYLSLVGVKEIRVIDHLKYGAWQNITSDNVKKYQIALDSKSDLTQCLEGVDYIFHLAAEKHNQSKDSPNDVFEANISGFYSLLSAAVESKVKKIVFTSSLYSYGFNQNCPMIEDMCPKPDTIYGISKLAGEGLLSYFKKQHNLDYTIFRLFFIYGTKQYAGMGYKSVIISNFERIINGLNPIINGDGKQTLDYTYVSDLVCALVESLDPIYNSQLFNFGSGKGTSINELTELMLEVANSKLTPEYAPADWTANLHRVADIKNLQQNFNWHPKIELIAGLTLVYDWILSKGIYAK